MKFSVAEKCDLPVCEICEFSKAPRRPKQSLIMTKHVTHDGSLKIGDIHPGSTISVDHFESRLLGCTFNSYGGPFADKFVGGCIFVDHASGFLHVEHKVGFSAVETIRARQNFENYVWIMVLL